MARYIIEAPHDPDTAACLRVLDSFLQAGAHDLARADWGCAAGVHKSWIVVEAESDEDARMMAPPIIRSVASVTRLNKFTPEEIAELHRQHD